MKGVLETNPLNCVCPTAGKLESERTKPFERAMVPVLAPLKPSPPKSIANAFVGCGSVMVRVLLGLATPVAGITELVMISAG